jgi:hypothetical protein
MEVGDKSPLQEYKRWKLGKIERNPQQQIQKQDEKVDSFTIQVSSTSLWEWRVLIIQLYNAMFSHMVRNLNKQLQHLFKYLHVRLKS